MKTKSAPKILTKVFVEVLQNGELIDSYSIPFSKSRDVVLSAQKGATLQIPEYPLAKSHIIIKKLGRGKAMVVVPQDWEGFITSLGEVHDIDSQHSFEKKYEISEGDYGSLNFRDLTFLFKIRKEKLRASERIKADRSYRGSVINLLVKSKTEWTIIGIAMTASVFIWSCFAGGLLVRPNDLPTSYADLDAKYVLPYISADHLRQIPEANQKELNRRNYIKSTLDYYRAYSQMVLGYEVDQDQLLFPNSVAAFRSYYNDQQDKVEEASRQQAAIDHNVQSESSQAIIRIPSVKGTSASHDLSRLMRTLNSYHESLKMNLAERRQFKFDFTNDPNYDMTKHGNIPKESHKPIFGKISFTGDDDDETTMYKTAEELATKAERAREFIDARKTNYKLPDSFLKPGIRLAGSSPYATYISAENFQTDSFKLDNIIAAEFNPRSKVKVKEPLTGELDPVLVSKTIDKRKFELQLCYELALRRNQKTLGKMEFSWRIDSRGAISDLKLLETTIRDKRMVNCVRQKIASWKFPRPRRGSIKIRYPFSFKPRRG